MVWNERTATYTSTNQSIDRGRGGGVSILLVIVFNHVTNKTIQISKNTSTPQVVRADLFKVLSKVLSAWKWRRQPYGRSKTYHNVVHHLEQRGAHGVGGGDKHHLLVRGGHGQFHQKQRSCVEHRRVVGDFGFLLGLLLGLLRWCADKAVVF